MFLIVKYNSMRKAFFFPHLGAIPIGADFFVFMQRTVLHNRSIVVAHRQDTLQRNNEKDNLSFIGPRKTNTKYSC